MRYIVFISAAVFIIYWMDRTGTLFSFLRFNPALIMRGEVWRIITWVFLPLNDNPFFTVLMLYFYFNIGGTLEREWGTPKFSVYYLSGVLINIIYGFIAFYNPWLRIVLLSPDFLNLSLFFAYAVLYPDHRILLFLIIPIKIKWLALINACFFVYSTVTFAIDGLYGMALLPFVALLNFIIICGGDLLDYWRPLKARASKQTINFRKAAKKARRDNEDKHHHRHKCAVCGKTDTEFPGLEFRYCSRCSGYHCFCIDHINNHVHFQ